MLFMTFVALKLSCVIVVALTGINACPDFRVASKTIITKSFFTEIMALGTIVHTLQLRMRLRQLPGGSDLRRGRTGREQAEHKKKQQAFRHDHRIQV
jgi:hypothetical protein